MGWKVLGVLRFQSRSTSRTLEVFAQRFIGFCFMSVPRPFLLFRFRALVNYERSRSL